MEKILTSGAKLSITLAPFEDAIELHDGVLESLKGVKLPNSVAALKEMDVEDILSGLISLSTSKRVRAGAFACGRYALYNGAKVGPELFDDPATAAARRQDYYAVVFEIAKANLEPFFVKTFSWLKALLPTAASTPEPK